MIYAFDSLGYAKRLRDKGTPQDYAVAERAFVMAELVTKVDLNGAVERLNARIDILESKLDTMNLRLTVRLGAMLAAVVALLAALQKLS
jgi:hypothetical protein